MAVNPIYAKNIMGDCEKLPISAKDILTAISSADDETKQAIIDELIKCECKETKDIFGDDV